MLKQQVWVNYFTTNKWFACVQDTAGLTVSESADAEWFKMTERTESHLTTCYNQDMPRTISENAEHKTDWLITFQLLSLHTTQQNVLKYSKLWVHFVKFWSVTYYFIILIMFHFTLCSESLLGGGYSFHGLYDYF